MSTLMTQLWCCLILCTGHGPEEAYSEIWLHTLSFPSNCDFFTPLLFHYYAIFIPQFLYADTWSKKNKLCSYKFIAELIEFQVLVSLFHKVLFSLINLVLIWSFLFRSRKQRPAAATCSLLKIHRRKNCGLRINF